MLGSADFEGLWSVSRSIADRQTGQTGGFAGRAALTPDSPGRLRYREDGLLRLGGGPAMQAHRVHLWQMAETEVDVRFEDGRPFHRFVPEGHAAGTDHPCGADLYRVAYDFREWPQWSAHWEVTGPRKDYAMRTMYRPA